MSEAALTPEQARLLPFYHDLRNEIVQPEKVVVSTQYFWSRWAPRLGPTLAVLVICLRRDSSATTIAPPRSGAIGAFRSRRPLPERSGWRRPRRFGRLSSTP